MIESLLNRELMKVMVITAEDGIVKSELMNYYYGNELKWRVRSIVSNV